MFEILKKFETKFAHLKKKGLVIEGLTIIDVKKKKHVIKISRPLIFDNRLIPKRFEGLDVKSNIKLNDGLPEEFAVDRSQPEWFKKEYIWAPERFEKYVNRCEKELIAELNIEGITKTELLDAICFGDFEGHKEKTSRLIEQGKLPKYCEN
jgi:hypothetical protein